MAESEKGMLWEPTVTESGRETVEEKSFYFVVVKLELIFSHPCFYVICACLEFFGEVGNFTERSGLLELCIIRKKLMIYRVISYDIGERCSVQAEENGSQYWALRNIEAAKRSNRGTHDTHRDMLGCYRRQYWSCFCRPNTVWLQCRRGAGWCRCGFRWWSLAHP